MILSDQLELIIGSAYSDAAATASSRELYLVQLCFSGTQDQQQPASGLLRFRAFSLQGSSLQGNSFGLGFLSGGASTTALHTRASTRAFALLTASTWISLSLAFEAWLKPFCRIALRRRTLPALTLEQLELSYHSLAQNIKILELGEADL